MIKNKFLFTLILALSAKILLPQDNPEFELLSLQEGVAHNLTYCMMKDGRGFLWFGTMYGLARFDGTGYTIFKHNPEDPESISFDDIVSLYEDKKGYIWIGTWGGGLNKYNPYEGTFQRFIYLNDNKNGINDNIVWAVTEDKEGNIWIGTERGGLNMYKPSLDKFIHYKHIESDSNSLPDNSVHSLLYDSKGNLWIGTNTGLSRFNKAKNAFDNFINNAGNKKSITAGSVRVIYEDSKQNIWVGTTNGLNKINKSNTFERYQANNSPNSLTSNFISCIAEDKDNLWIGTGYGLNYFNIETKQFTGYYHNPDDSKTLSGNSIHNILLDNSGLLWVNVYNSGINKEIKPSKDNFTNLESYTDYRGTFSTSNVLSLAEGIDGRVWIGTRTGLNYYNPETKTLGGIPGDTNPGKNFINALSADYNGNIWVGTRAGLRLFNPSALRFYEPDFNLLKEAGLLSSNITSVFCDSLIVWIGTYNSGLFKLNRKTNSLIRYSYEGKHFDNYQADFILTVFKDKSSRIWIGTFGGLMMYNSHDNSFLSFTNNPDTKTSLSNNYVFCIFQDSREELWIGTANGLNRFIPANSTFEHFFEKDGLPNGVICAIVEDSNNNLWLSTNKGISKFNSKEMVSINYDNSDGVGGNLFNRSAGLSGKYGNIMFGGSSGCLLFFPAELKFSQYNSPIYISSIIKTNNNGERSLYTAFKNEFEISSSEKVITLNFASLDYSNPHKNKFLYMLEGINSGWINAGNRNSVTYTNLEPGEYIFKVKGTNSDGIISSNIAELKLIVVPHFWQTWWFELLFVLLLFSGTFFFIRHKIRLKIKRELEHGKIREEEAAKIRKQTAADFHDELGHRLTRISLLSEMIRKKLHNSFIEIDPMLKSISENSQSLYEGTRDFIWAINPEQDTLHDLIIRLKDFGDELFSGTKIKFGIKGLNESLQKVPVNIEWKRHINLIFKEAMNNSLKHSECNNVNLEVELRNNGKVEIFLFDNGNGFDVEKVYSGNGLPNMIKRAEKIGGYIDIDSRLNVGTKILFKGIIPLNSIDYTRKVA